MKLRENDRRAVAAGAAIVAATLIIAYVGMPLVRQWRDLRDTYAVKARVLANMRRQAERRAVLERQRETLAERLGALAGAPPPSAKPKGGPPKPGAPAPQPKADSQSKAAESVPEKASIPAPPLLVTEVERAAKKAGVKIKSVKPRRPVVAVRKGRYYAPTGLHVQCACPVQALVKLMCALEKGERLARVEHLELRRDPKKGQNMDVTLHLVGYEEVAREQ